MSEGEIQAESFWSMESGRLLDRLQTSRGGLSRAEAAERLRHASRLRPRRPSAWMLLLDQFKSPIMLLLFCSALLSLTLINDATNGVIILFILVASGLLGFWQEWSAADAVAKLSGLIATRATVVREGRDVEVPLDEVVAGDIIRLRAGDLVPGDCRLLESQDLYVNESVLTGESFPAEKVAGDLPADCPLGRRTNALHLGTHVVSGLATAVVAGAGQETEFGKISARLAHRPPETGFERGLRRFGQLLIKIVLAITVVVFAVKVGVQQRPLVESLMVGLALAVGMTPQLLPAVTSVVLATGAKAMSRHQVIVKQLLAIENLGSMTILCSDKTGTLTEGEIKLHSAVDVAGSPCDYVWTQAYCNAALQTGFLNPIDRAIQQSRQLELSDVEKLDEVPYDFIRKRLSVRIRRGDERQLITKGALAQILDVCTRVRLATGEEIEFKACRDEIERQFLAWSNSGLRVLGLAQRLCDVPHATKDDERDMTFLGFLVFSDPPKADAPQTLESLRQLGVQLKVITGDNRAVAEAVSLQVGLRNPVIMTGSELRQLLPEAIRNRVAQVDVFAEIEPNQKEQIILALKQTGQTVGYLGDGINDASALHAADVGISVASAVDVAREAAQVVFMKQDLSVLVDGVREGRKTFANTLKYVFFAIAANFGYMFSLAVSSLFLPFEPLLAHQILLVNLLADFPAMALATDNVDPEQIHRPRQWDSAFILRFMLSFGLASSMFDFLTFGAIVWVFGTQDPALFQTGWFVESALTGLMILMIIRTQRPFLLSRPGRLFLFAVAVVAAIIVWLPYSPFAETFGFVTPPVKLITIAIGITLLYGVGMEIVKRWFYHGANLGGRGDFDSPLRLARPAEG